MTTEIEGRLRRDLNQLADLLMEAPSAEPASNPRAEPSRRTPARARRRAFVAATAALALLVTAAAILRSQGTSQPDTVEAVPDATTPTSAGNPSAPMPPDAADRTPIARPLAPAPVDSRVSITPAGPHRAGDTVTIVAPRSVLADPANDRPSLCFSWANSEICDPTTWATTTPGTADDSSVRWQRPLPGWVNTPAGIRSCDQLGCRVVIPTTGGQRIGTNVLTIEPGARPTDPATLRVEPDGSLRLRSTGISPHPSWTTAQRDAAGTLTLPALTIQLCVYAETLTCDVTRRPLPSLPDDGARFDVAVPATRLLLTPWFPSWVDCTKATCALAIHRTIVVRSGSGLTGDIGDPIAFLPYLLPDETPDADPPSLTIETPAPLSSQETVTVRITQLPAGIDPANLRLGQCTADDLRLAMDCVFLGSPFQSDGSRTYRAVVSVRPCSTASGCYLALLPKAEGAPDLARTQRFFAQ